MDTIIKCQGCGHENPPEARFCANCGSSLDVITGPAVPVTEDFTGPEEEKSVEYMGFWIRFGAAIVDWIILSLVSMLFNFIDRLSGVFQFGFIVWLLYFWLFTGLKGQTPGKMALGIKVVNSEGVVPGLGYGAMREILGKIISTVVIFIGFIWIAGDRQKRGWHDIIAGTYVVKAKPGK